MLEIKDSVAVITGGSGGIGMVLAEYWTKRGGKAVIADIAEDAEPFMKLTGVRDGLIERIISKNGNGRLIKSDPTNEGLKIDENSIIGFFKKKEIK